MTNNFTRSLSTQLFAALAMFSLALSGLALAPNSALAEGSGSVSCSDELSGGWADEAIDSDQGQRNDDTDVLGQRSNPASAQGEPDGDFFSLGFGGRLEVKFDKFVPDVDGDDLSIHEITEDRDTYPEETAVVAVSQDGSNWHTLSETASNQTSEGGAGVTLLDLSETGLDWIQYVRITDTTDGDDHDEAADGYDVDAVDATEERCDEPGDGDNDGEGDEEPDTVNIKFVKKFDGVDNGFEPEEFAFQVVGDGFSETLDHDVALPFEAGDYTVTEIGPDEFDENDWRIKWTCPDVHMSDDDDNDHDATFAVTSDNYKDGSIFCTAENQYRPGSGGDDDNGDDNGGDDNIGDDGNNGDDGDNGDNNGDNGDDGQPKYKVFGYVWHDENENQAWDGFGDEAATTTEDDLDGWTVTITNGTTTHSTTTDESGYYEFSVPAGTWTITEEVQAEWTKTYPDENAHVVEIVDETLAQAEAPQSFLATVVGSLVPTAHAQTPTTYGPFNFGNFFTGSTDSSDSSNNDRSRGGGSSNPRCEALEATQDGDTVTLTWDTFRGQELTIDADGTEIFATDDDDEVDEGFLNVAASTGSEFELTVFRGSRSDDCRVTIGDDSTGRGGGPTPEVLGEQVSVVPVGGASAGAGGAAPAPVSIPSATPFVAAMLVMAPRRNG